MIVFKKIKWKNFLSTGNKFTEINLTEAKTNLIIGNNGAGKSTILDALTFSLFNRPFRKVNKSQLINTVNEKDCVVELEFTIGATDWKVLRGMKPVRFEIYKNGNVMNQNAAVNDQQRWLEEHVLKLNYKSFTQIVILGSASFVPFMQLTAPNRREVIEDLLDIKIFSAMGLILKERVRGVNERLREISIKKNLLEEKIDMQNGFIQEIENTSKKDVKDKKDKIKSINEQIDRYEDDLKEMSEELDAINKDMEIQISNMLPFGEFWINEQEAADAYNVSRTIIRQTLSQLAERGLIFKDARSHWIVGPLTSKRLNDLFMIRSKLEPLALGDAAHYLENAELKNITNRCYEARDSEDDLSNTQIQKIEMDLHVYLLSKSKNNYLTRLISQTQLALVVNNIFSQPMKTRPFSAAVAEHIIIYEYLGRGSIDAAMMALETHLLLSAKRTSQRLKALSIFPAPKTPIWLTRR